MSQPQSVLVAMSGGVDSSVAAALLQREGLAVVGVTLRLVRDQDDVATKHAAAVAQRLGIEHHVLDLTDLFEEEVVGPFCSEYLAGRTPNPCVRCNQHVKFGALVDHARQAGASHLATGHYARIIGPGQDSRFALLRGVDSFKDQSYALFGLSQTQLAHALFPLGGVTKSRVRELAGELNLPPLRAESQDVCFLSGPYADFVLERAGRHARPGPIVDTAGRPLGQHRGIVHYTVGQRRGLGIGGGDRLYVVHIDAERDLIVAGEDAELFGREFTVTTANWIAGEAADGEVEAEVAVRYNMQAAPAVLYEKGDHVRVTFRKPQRGITPGQAAVFYQGEHVLGGGTVDRRLDLALPFV